MKQMLVCEKVNRKLQIKKSILTDVYVHLEDVISPQKTKFVLPKQSGLEVGDTIIIRDNVSAKVEYIGYIDAVNTKDTTELMCYPLIKIFDNDFVLDQMFKTVPKKVWGVDEKKWIETGEQEDFDVDVLSWLSTQIKRAFIYTDDDLQHFPFEIRKGNDIVLYKRVLDTSNLFEIYVDLFLQTGVYIEINEVKFNKNVVEGIYLDIKSNTKRQPYTFRWDDLFVRNISITDNTFNHFNKLIVTQELEEDAKETPSRFYFYLLNNNDITTVANDSVRIEREIAEDLPAGSLGRRIKFVRSKEISFKLDADDNEVLEVARDYFISSGMDESEVDELLKNGIPSEHESAIGEAVKQSRANALIQCVRDELQAPEYDLKIEITMKPNSEIQLYRNVEFLAENGVAYYSNVTKIEKVNDLEYVVTLGALRNSLTDFKKKVEGI